MSDAQQYFYTDYMDRYEPIMQFNKNKSTYIHGWYPFVEGYSKEFIKDILAEVSTDGKCCLDPFAGSGTTPVELQKMKTKCYSFEVNPFMYNIAIAKMRIDYTVAGFNENYDRVELAIKSTGSAQPSMQPPSYGPITQREDLTKWNFNKEVMAGLLDIKGALSELNDFRYRNLFKIGLASILLEVSNVYRNGKTYSYRDNWENSISFSRHDIHEIYLTRLKEAFSPDIKTLNEYICNQGDLFSNHDYCILGDCRVGLSSLDDNSIDLVITSPPYLNSRDYTDTYMIELWMLDYIMDYESLGNLRRKTIRSHVQVKWDDVDCLDIAELRDELNQLSKFKDVFWNKSLENMIKGYFKDFDDLFSILRKKMSANGVVYFNVANSAYYGIEIRTDYIIAEIASRNGFSVCEIRRARKIRPSSQQKDLIPFLWEVVIKLSRAS